MIEHSHTSVLLEEAVAGLDIKPDGIYIDATLGRGGHSRAILSKLTTGRLIAIDRDPDAIKAADELIKDPRVIIIHGAFADLYEHTQRLNLIGKVNGILMDLGVSSPQLDNSCRGFSFMHQGPLDMRMDNSKGNTAADWLNSAPLDEIIRVFRTYGEEKYAAHIARCIVADRIKTPFTTTKSLADFIVRVSKTKEKHKHPATRIFQAIRIHINGEIEQIEQALISSLDVLAPCGRLAVISFHSLEDRVVKQFMRKHSQAAEVPFGLPVSEDELNKHKKLSLCGRAIKPSEQEVASNPRSRSSILRIAQRLGYND